MRRRFIARVGVILGAIALSVVASGQAPQVFRAQVAGVRVDVAVTEGRRPVALLSASDFEIVDNGVAQRVTVVEEPSAAIHVTLVLDTSGSVAGGKLGQLLDASRALISALDRRDAATLLTFSQVLAAPAGVAADRSTVMRALDNVRAGGRTALYDAVLAGYQVAAGRAERSLLVVFSDATDNASWFRQDAVLDSVRRANVVAYPVMVGDVVTTRPDLDNRRYFLQELADRTGGNLFAVGGLVGDMEKTFLRVLDEFRSRYVLVYTPQGVREDGWHTLKVSVKGRRATVKGRPGYFGVAARR